MAEFTINVPGAADLPPPSGANYFSVSTHGPDVELMVGYVSLREIALLGRGEAEKPAVDAIVTHRFFMTLQGLVDLKRQIDAVISQLQEQGLVHSDGGNE
jgi:hypothetical protein